MYIAKSDMLDLVNGLEHTALAALEGRTTKRDIQEQFNLIKKAVEKWEDGKSKTVSDSISQIQAKGK